MLDTNRFVTQLKLQTKTQLTQTRYIVIFQPQIYRINRFESRL